MRFNDLTLPQQIILSILFHAPNGLKRLEIKEKLNGKAIPDGTISSTLNRLEAYGLTEKPEFGSPWKISAQGRQLFPDSLSAPKTVPEPEPEPEPEPAPEPEPKSFGHDLSKQLLHAMEIEVALDQVRTQLRIPHIPAQAARIYLRILDALPPILVEALAPITDLVKSELGNP